MITNFKLFEGKYVNKFDFEIDQSYEYDDLPKKVQKDIDVQFDDEGEYAPDDYNYIFKLLPLEEYGEYVENAFGQYDIVDAMEHSYMKKLVKDIEKRGIDYPSVGFEGNHRALACYMMNKPLPYLQMELKSEEELEKKYNEE